ncbi:CoA transferase [Thiomonas bhubaneswarensis]|uniref:CoA-transferase family III n=1 Tax=Thiomonas bhubaneswarensis TaxID=339866 RepID=A0A0K6I7A2_9BURK|nr:CoA transferase [Thiomonas bhubaneswarensis]CUA99005.1 CoA-transferase family III [Thiomonas bhubaneswarensis]
MPATDRLYPRHPRGFKPLLGVRIATLALNLPGPAAAARLKALGAEVVKIEPPGGDPMAQMSPALYRAMHKGVPVRTLDLKSQEGQTELQEVLQQSDLLLTAFRPAALKRLGLDRRSLAARYPRLSAVFIFGYPGAQAHLAGHDLTFQAEAGLIDSARLPTTLLADMMGAMLVCEAALAALLQAKLQGQGAQLDIALSDAAGFAAVPRALGMTVAGELLGGALPEYGVYVCADGLVAIAALEPHFQRALAQVAQGTTRRSIARWCKAHSAAQLNALTRQHDLPLWAWTT